MDREVTPWRALERMKILRIMPAKKQSIQVDGGENTDVDKIGRRFPDIISERPNKRPPDGLRCDVGDLSPENRTSRKVRHNMIKCRWADEHEKTVQRRTEHQDSKRA